MIRFLSVFILVYFSINHANAQRTFKIEYDKDSLEENYTVSTLRFYLSNIQFHVKDDSWYSDEVNAHLIDLEDPKSWEIELPKNASKSRIDSVSFLLGVDSTTNVAGILEGDLDPINGMYWAWNSGYINFKVEGEKKTSMKKYEYHLGGYLRPFATSRQVVLSRDSKQKKLILHLELKPFLDEINMDELNEVMIPGPDAVILSDSLSKCFNLE